MGVAALVLGIVSIIIAFIPFCGSIAFIPAVIGLILGIVDLVKKNKAPKEGEETPKKGMSIAGIILSALAIVIIWFWLFVLGTAGSAFVNELNTTLDQANWNEVVNDMDWNSIFE